VWEVRTANRPTALGEVLAIDPDGINLAVIGPDVNGVILRDGGARCPIKSGKVFRTLKKIFARIGPVDRNGAVHAGPFGSGSCDASNAPPVVCGLTGW